ncbi:MAG: DUF2911 domain-containing protein, partial [Fimbriimonadaceae bacterium]|nr:DUF2911 domain-containing protein [Chitinophagales bacterium]
IFSTNSKQWGAFKYNEAEDALRIKVKPNQSDSLYEDMFLYVKPDVTTNTAGKIQFAWEKLMLEINFENASGK